MAKTPKKQYLPQFFTAVVRYFGNTVVLGHNISHYRRL